MDGTISKLSSMIRKFFVQVTYLDDSIRFIKRTSKKITAASFVETLVLGFLSDSHISLEGLCLLFKKRGISITKQGLHQRYSDTAAKLMKATFETAVTTLGGLSGSVCGILSLFSSVNIIDSTVLSLPKELKNLFKGYGGSASEAGARVQVVYDYLHKKINQLVVTAANKNDLSFEEHLVSIQKNALYLQDLGYFKIISFFKLHQSGAYFISRFLPKTRLFDINGKPIELQSRLNSAPKGGLTLYAFLGEKDKVPVRLVARPLSPKQAQQRINKLKQSAKKRGYQLSPITLFFASWSLCVTNVPLAMINNANIYLIYSVRWQIELFFKLCKGDAGIDKIQAKNIHHILCDFYAKMIGVTLLLFFSSAIQCDDNDISFHKAFKYLRQQALLFFSSLKSSSLLSTFIRTFLSDLEDFAFKDKYSRRKHTIYQKLAAK